jgi:hypothetical protein
VAVPALSEMLANITSPATTPVGLLRISDVALPLAVVALPRWKMVPGGNVDVGVGVGVGVAVEVAVAVGVGVNVGVGVDVGVDVDVAEGDAVGVGAVPGIVK